MLAGWGILTGRKFVSLSCACDMVDPFETWSRCGSVTNREELGSGAERDLVTSSARCGRTLHAAGEQSAHNPGEEWHSHGVAASCGGTVPDRLMVPAASRELHHQQSVKTAGSAYRHPMLTAL